MDVDLSLSLTLVEAFIIWALAIYGAMILIWQSVRRIRKRTMQLTPMSIVLVVQNAEVDVEGLLRTMMVKTAFGLRERYIVVLDVASRDETERIARNLAKQHQCVEYVRIEREEDLLPYLKQLCFDQGQPRVSCIYDLRRKEMRVRVIDDVIGLFKF